MQKKYKKTFTVIDAKHVKIKSLLIIALMPGKVERKAQNTKTKIIESSK